jgi:hypothetical protein
LGAREFDVVLASLRLADFGEASALSFEAALNEARGILLKERPKLEKLVSMLKQRVRSVDFNLARLPEKRMHQTEKLYRVLLNKQELEPTTRPA